MGMMITPTQLQTLKDAYAQAKATETKGFQTNDLALEGLGHGQAKGIRETLATIMGVDPADVVEVLRAA